MVLLLSLTLLLLLTLPLNFFMIIVMIILPRLCSSLTDWSSNRLQGSHTILQELRLLPLSRFIL